MFTPSNRPRPGAALLGLAAAALLPLGPPAARAQNGTPGTPGAVGLTLPDSFTFNDPNASYQGASGGDGGPGGPGYSLLGYSSEVGGQGGAGVLATGTNANITILSGTFSGGGGGAGGKPGMGSPTVPLTFGGAGGDAFAATGAGTNITILAGNFHPGPGSSGGSRYVGGNDGSDFSTSAGETASVYGGNFRTIFGGAGLPNGAISPAFALNGSNVTVYGTFLTQPGGPSITTPQTFTNSSGSFFGILANNTTPGQTYYSTSANGGNLTLSPPPICARSLHNDLVRPAAGAGPRRAGRRGAAEEDYPLTSTAGGMTTTLPGTSRTLKHSPAPAFGKPKAGVLLSTFGPKCRVDKASAPCYNHRVPHSPKRCLLRLSGLPPDSLITGGIS